MKQRWFRRDLGALSARMVGAGMQMVAVVVIGRAFGAEVLGGYLIFQSVTRTAGSAISFGDPWWVMRAVSEHDALGDYPTSTRIFDASMRLQNRLMAGATALWAVFLVGAALLGELTPSRASVATATLVGTGAYVYTAIAVSGMKARHRQSSALLLEFAVPPVAVTVWALAADTSAVAGGINGVLWSYTAAAVAAAAWSVMAWRRTGRNLPTPDAATASASSTGHLVESDATAVRSTRAWFGLTNLTNAVGQNLGSLALPLVLSLTDVGRIGAALRITSIPGTIGLGLSSVYAPLFARQWVKGDRRALKRSLLTTQIWTVALFAPFVVAFVFAPGLLAHLFGEDFEGTAGAVRVLGLGQLANALSGQAPMLLSMCRDEMFAMWATVAAVVLGLIATLVGGAWWGLVGAAFGQSLMLVVRNLVVWFRAVHTVIPSVPDPLDQPAALA